jgi:cellobiose-specific phosphotransferase system component IIB
MLVETAILTPLNPEKELTMTVFKPLLLICSLGLSGAVLAQDASVTISSPADGAKVSASAPTKVTYDVVPGPKGDHVHLYVDGGEATVLRQLKGTTTVDTLKAGPHTLCIKVVDKAHTPIGVEKCIKVTAG